VLIVNLPNPRSSNSACGMLWKTAVIWPTWLLMRPSLNHRPTTTSWRHVA